MNKTLIIMMVIAMAAFAASCTSETQASTPAPEDKAAAPSKAPTPTLDRSAADAPAAEPLTDGAPKSFDAPPKPGQKATCPVMDAEFVVTDKSERSEYKGKHVAFCCPGCKGKFDADPEKYLK